MDKYILDNYIPIFKHEITNRLIQQPTKIYDVIRSLIYYYNFISQLYNPRINIHIHFHF